MEIVMLPTNAPSILTCALRLPPASTTAMSIHGLPDLLGLPRGAVDDPPRLLQRYGLLRLRGFRHTLPFPLLSVYARSRAVAPRPRFTCAGTISDTRALFSCSLVVPSRR